MDQQQLADSPAFSFLHGQLSMVLAGCQQLPCGWQQQEEFQSLLQQALDMLQQPIFAAAQADSDCSADTSNDKCSKQKQPAADQDKRKQQQQQKQQPYIALDIHDTDTGDYAAAAAAVADELTVLGSPSSSSSELLQALGNLAAAVQEEYAEVLESETPVRSAICAAGGLNHLLLLITTADSSSSTATPCNATTSSNSSMEVAIAAGALLLAVTESRGGSHRYCNLWAHHFIETAAVPALVRLLLFHDALAKRAAELLASLARDGNRHTEIAAAGGIAGLLHVLAGNGAGPLAGKAPAAGRPYAVLAAAAAAVEALIEDGPLDVQVAVAEAGGVAVLEGICEHLVRQKMARRQRNGPSKQHAACRSALTVEIPA